VFAIESPEYPAHEDVYEDVDQKTSGFAPFWGGYVTLPVLPFEKGAMGGPVSPQEQTDPDTPPHGRGILLIRVWTYPETRGSFGAVCLAAARH